MSHLTVVQLIAGAFALILGTVMAIRSFLKNSGEEMAAFRDYFGAEYHRGLLQQSAWCDDENLYDRWPRYAFNILEQGVTKRRQRGGHLSRRNRD